MKVRYGNIEFIDPTWEEIDALVARYGASGQAESTGNGTLHHREPGNTALTNADRVALAKLITAGETGVLTTVLGDLLGKRGRAVPGAIVEWSRRIGLASNAEVNALETARPEGKRGWKIKKSLMHLAEEIAKR